MADIVTMKDPLSGELVVPDGRTSSWGYRTAQPLTEGAVAEIVAKFARERDHLEIFNATLREGSVEFLHRR